jgi:hypothetical protein
MLEQARGWRKIRIDQYGQSGSATESSSFRKNKQPMALATRHKLPATQNVLVALRNLVGELSRVTTSPRSAFRPL